MRALSLIVVLALTACASGPDLAKNEAVRQGLVNNCIESNTGCEAANTWR